MIRTSFLTSLFTLGLLAGGVLTLGACASTPEPPVVFSLSQNPLRVTVEQRKSKEVADLSVRLRLGGITEKHAVVELLGPDGTPVVDTRAMELHDSVELVLGTQTFVMKLAELNIVPAGNDFAVFEFSAAPSIPSPEAELAPTVMPDSVEAEESAGDIDAP